MMLLRVFRFLVVFALLVASAAHANLTQLQVTFAPAQETFVEGETVTVTATTDNIANAEYRFYLQVYDNNAWAEVVDSGWVGTSSYTLGDELSSADPGNYRLVTYARASDNPDEFIANYQTFFYQTTIGLAVCDWLEGKTFVSEGPTTQFSDTLSLADATSALSTGYDFPFATDADKLGTLSFTSGTQVAYVTLAHPLEIVTTGFLGLGASEAWLESPMEGSYSCVDNTLSVNASGDAVVESGLASAAGVANVSVSTSGDASVDMEAGTIVTGGMTFRLQSAGEPVATDGGAAGRVLLLMLCLFGILRRRLG